MIGRTASASGRVPITSSKIFAVRCRRGDVSEPGLGAYHCHMLQKGCVSISTEHHMSIAGIASVVRIPSHPAVQSALAKDLAALRTRPYLRRDLVVGDAPGGKLITLLR